MLHRMDASPRRSGAESAGSAGSHKAGGVAFLLAQLGAHAAERFAARIAELDLTPPQVGILRAIAVDPGRSQQQLSGQLGLLPSQVVAFVDRLEDRGYVERRRSTTDRRLYALQLTASGQELMTRIAAVGQAHDEEFTASLTAGQRQELAAMLQTLAASHGLAPGVHPGYKLIGREAARERAPRAPESTSHLL
jgi:DNA-binding MarR family transcriptional regulator